MLFFAAICHTAPAAERLSPLLIPLREAVYEQKLTADEVRPLYLAAKAAVTGHYYGATRYIALSRCEYFMGRVLQFEKRNSEAATHYAEGLRLAETALEIAPSAGAWVMMAENLSQSCVVRSNAFAMRHGLNVERYAKNALAIDRRNAAAQYIVAARWVYAPSPFNNLRRGIEMMKAVITEGDMDKDDRFNVYSAIGYAYIKQRRHTDARPWLQKSLEIYPSNQFAAELLTNTGR